MNGPRLDAAARSPFTARGPDGPPRLFRVAEVMRGQPVKASVSSVDLVFHTFSARPRPVDDMERAVPLRSGRGARRPPPPPSGAM